MTPKSVLSRWLAAFNAHDADALSRLYADDAINHQVANEPVRGKQAITEMFRREFAAVDMTCLVENMFEDGEWAIMEWRDPTGFRGCGFFRVVDGAIVFQRGYWDKLSFLRLNGLPVEDSPKPPSRGIKVVGFDADDTLWVNMPFFTKTEARFCELLSAYGDAGAISREQYHTEKANMRRYGFGTKSYTLSMLETALRLSHGSLSAAALAEIMDLGKGILEHPLELLDGVADVLACLRGRFRLIVATKGDPTEQERKLDASGLREYFHHIEIMPDKTEAGYAKLLRHLDIEPAEFLMVGNSVKSDIEPVLAVGGYAAHVPYHDTWVHEQAEAPEGHARFFALASLRDLPGLPLLREGSAGSC